jgi:Amt family ammonium transporter
MHHPGTILRKTLAGLALLLGLAAPLGALAETTTADLEKRVAGLEAYLHNTDPTGSAVAGVSGPGHNGWMMVCSALVLFMTLPGLALFYGGLVRKKNVLSVLAQCIGIAGLVTILWWAVGYSFAFGKSFGSPFVGGSEFFFLQGVTSAPNTDYAYWVSQNVFSMYQLMFAIITPALILGAIAERIKFVAVLAVVTLWMLIVYFPLAHMVWGINGFMNGVWNAAAGIKAIDFAGGTVVHMSSGWSALVLCLILGPRLGFGKEKISPHNVVLCMVGTGMLWVGWYGFNAGSAIAADGVAANAFMTTTLAAAIAGFVWGLLEYLVKGKASVVGLCTGIVAGLVVITPAAGFVNSRGSVVIGILAAVVPYLFCTKVKEWLKYDDALDTFGVHAVGGTLGALVTGFLATADVNGNLSTNLREIVGHTLWLEQLKAIGVTLALSLAGTALIGFAVKAILGLRPHHEHEQQGLDLADHGEEGYAT